MYQYQRFKAMDIKRTIKANGLTVKEVAEKMGITPVGLSQHINGNPSVEVLERIAAAIAGKTIVKEITVPNKIINIVVR